MSDVTRHSIALVKTSERNLDEDKLKGQVNRILGRIASPTRQKRGWKAKLSNSSSLSIPRQDNGKFVYTAEFAVICKPLRRSADSLEQEFTNIVKVVSQASNSQKWTIVSVDGDDASQNSAVAASGNSPVTYVPISIPDGWKDYYKEIYERDSQIEIILSSLRASIASGFSNRFHCALCGEPAVGKTAILKCLKTMVGDEAVLEYDATATTQAGAIRDLAEREELPRILIVEEIEKTDENSLRWLLSVLDHRAEISKVNYRQQVHKEAKLLTFATVNDYKLFNSLMSGALASRFAYHLSFPKLSRSLLKRILEREVAKHGGLVEAIEPTLDYAEEMEITDPRKVTAICICGGMDLLRGEYQTKLRECHMD